MSNTILILTNKEDTHVDGVIRWMSAHDIQVFRLNSEDLISQYRTHLYIDRQGSWGGTISDQVGRVLDLARLKVAWFRKPEFDFFGKQALSAEEEFATSETKALINILYTMPHIRWINDPFIANRAKVKFQQLLLARSMNIKVPRTLITNQPHLAKDFFVECGQEVLVKTIYTNSVNLDGVTQGIPSRKVGVDEFYKYYESIALSPTQFQEYVKKAFELRVTVVGERVFAVKIDSQLHEETRVDWRLYTQLNPHSVYKLPEEIDLFCVKFLQEQRLLFGAMDFIVTPEGEYYFLENNPFGQYLWLEYETNLPLTEEMCNLLIHYLNS